MILPFERIRTSTEHPHKLTVCNGTCLAEIFMSDKELDKALRGWISAEQFAGIDVRFTDGTTITLEANANGS
jgi:hypothetical protein